MSPKEMMADLEKRIIKVQTYQAEISKVMNPAIDKIIDDIRELKDKIK